MREFNDKPLDEDFVFNASEMHLLVTPDDGRTIAMEGDLEVRYSDVVSGNMGMTMMVMLGDGSKPPFKVSLIILQNDRCSQPIHGVPDTVPGVCYWSSPKGWMDTSVF